MLNLGNRLLEWFDFMNALDNLRTILRGAEMISFPVSSMPDDSERAELFELDLALVPEFSVDVDPAVAAGLGLEIVESLSDFLDAVEDDLGLPLRPNENRRVLPSFSLYGSSGMTPLPKSGSPSSIICC